MAKPNYQFEKRKRDMDKKAKKAEKKAKKEERATTPSAETETEISSEAPATDQPASE